jgi:AMMECR1 domain-containing protein
MIERGLSRGLLLPQVAVELAWDRETFLDHTCRKAGLEPGCWRHPDTVISTFCAEVFGE